VNKMCECDDCEDADVQADDDDCFFHGCVF
jgi:hypothetical protein